MSEGKHSGRRSILCVPAVDPHRIAKALAAGADEVVVDLEDAVAPAEKEAARDVVASFDWSAHARPPALAVRVNAPGSRWCHQDLACVVQHVPAASIVLPKVESRGDLEFAERLLDGLEEESGRAEPVLVQALVETAAGLSGLAGIVAGARRGSSRLSALILGYADLAASLGRAPQVGLASWVPVQEALLWAARAAGVEAVDGPFLGVADDQPFREAAGHSAALGYDAKWAIHPRQVSTLNEIFGPSAEVVAHAERVLEVLSDAASAGRGAVQLDGQLLDEAMAVAARRTLAKAGR